MVSYIEFSWIHVISVSGGLWLLFAYLNYGNDTDSALIQRAKNSDTRAFDELVRRYQQQLYYSVIRIVLSQDDADDVVQEAFIKAYRNLDSYNENYRFYSWIYRIAINTALNLVQRRKSKEVSLERKHEENRFEPPHDGDPAQDYAHKEMHDQVTSALNNLHPDMRTVFILRVYNELTYKEIAEIMDTSTGTVMSRLYRARAALMQLLEKIGWTHNDG